MFVLMVIVIFFFREFGKIMVTFCISFDTSIIILLILITIFRGFGIPELQDRSKIFPQSLLTLLFILFSQHGFQLFLPLGQIQNQGLERSVLSLEILD